MKNLMTGLYRAFSRLTAFGLLLSALAFLQGCGDDGDSAAPKISLIGATANGLPLTDGTINVDPDATFELTFSGTLSASAFESALSLSGGSVGDLSVTYTSASSKAVISATLGIGESYTLSVPRGAAIGASGAELDRAVSFGFQTADGGVVTEQEPCLSGSAACLKSFAVSDGAGGTGGLPYYGSFPLELENAEWANLKTAVIVVHGVQRNADEYFDYMMSAIRDQGKEDEVILIAPFFQDDDDSQNGEIHWNSSSWREGAQSGGAVSTSSFAAVDQIVAALADPVRFPVMEKVVVTGHSSGGLFAQAYAAASRAEADHPDLEFRYVVANSQYFYYPDDVRYDPNTDDFAAVTGCPTFNHWPMGYVNAPSYLDGVDEATVDSRIIARDVTYLLGTNDVATGGTLNTDDCEATLLGEHRFARGENIVRLLEENHASATGARKVTVPGVGHDAQAMYRSTAFADWLESELP